MKRLLALVMGLMLVLSSASLALASDETLVVGSTTRLSGDFFAGLWSANTADNDVRALIHDAATVAWMENSHYGVNQNAILSFDETDAEKGGKTYTFRIRPDMQFSDGSAITAQDYVFSVLLLSSPQLSELDVQTNRYMHLTGYDQFAGGGAFTGVRLLAEDAFSLTVQGAELPYFYDLAMVNVTPYPMALIAPDCHVQDDGNGAYIAGDFTAALLQETILDSENGYLSHPSVVSGAYKLTAYDHETGVAEFERNEFYMGNYEGQKPSIEKLKFQEVKNDTLIAQIQNGKVDLVNKVSRAPMIEQGIDAGLSYAGYPRAGFGYLAFACEKEPTSSLALRKAVSMCIDRTALCKEAVGKWARPVYGYYGIGQWMVAEKSEPLKQLKTYEKDLESARWQAQKSGYLGTTLKMAIPAENDIANALVAQLKGGFEKIGLGLEVTELPMHELLHYYYRQTERTYDMFFLASNFDYVFDPYYTFHTDDAYQGISNRSGLKDAKLMKLANEMRHVKRGDTKTYLRKWLEFQKYFAQVLPMVPLYSNYYFDFYTDSLKDYDISEHASWASAILYAGME